MYAAGKEVRAFRIADDIAELWATTLTTRVGQSTPIIDGHAIVGFQGADGAEVAALALDSGTITKTLMLPGRTPRRTPASLRAIGDGLLTVSIDGGGDIPDALAVIDASAGSLRTVWTRTYGAGHPHLPTQAARLGDLVVGWSNQAGGPGLVTYALRDGEFAWAHRATSFDNSGGLVATVADQIAVISPFGGAWLELVDASGAVVELTDPPEGYQSVQQFTVLDERRVIATGEPRTAAGLHLRFVDVCAPVCPS